MPLNRSPWARRRGASTADSKKIMKRWTIWLAVWLLIAMAIHFAPRRTVPEKSERVTGASVDPTPPGRKLIGPSARTLRTDKPAELAWHGPDSNIPLQHDPMPLTADRRIALVAAALAIAQSNPPAAVELASKYQLDNGNGDVLPNLAQQWAESDFDSAMNWAVAQPPSPQRDQIFTHLAMIKSQTAPVEAANLVIKEIPPGPAQQEAAITVLHQWMLQDFAAASAWADQFPEGPIKQRAEAELAGGAAYLLVSQPAATDVPGPGN
jgi:hypothetical protein